MTKRKIIYFVFLTIITIGIIACRNNSILSRDKMINVLHDIQIAEALQQNKYEDFNDTESKDALIEGVLMKHGISQAQLDSSLVWYSDNVEVYLKVNDSVISTLKKEGRETRETIQRRARKRKNNNFAILPNFTYLTKKTPTLTFSVDSFLIQQLPNFIVEFKTLWMKENMDADLSVMFYYTDTTLIDNLKIKSDSNYRVTRPNKTERLKYISGYIHLNTEQIKPNEKLLLYDITVIDSISNNNIDSLKISYKEN